jgi:Na+/citrate or Na+/malate symporter
MKMRKSTQFVRAFVAASVLTGMMVIGTPIHAGGMGDGLTSCPLAQGIIYKVPAFAREVLKGVFEGLLGCDTLTVVAPTP